MKKFAKFAIAALTLALGTGAMAQEASSEGSSLKPGGVFVEPMITYQTGDNTFATSQLFGISDDTSGKIDGFGVGLRAGAHISEIVFLGLDARFAQLKMKDSSYGSTDGQAMNYGASVGAQMPWYGVRAWGTYVFGGNYDPNAGTATLNPNIKAEQAKGYRLGAGIKLMNVSVNLEYEDLNYDRTRITNGASIATNIGTDVDFKTKSWILGVSFPFAL